jgi:hypothetical protein
VYIEDLDPSRPAREQEIREALTQAMRQAAPRETVFAHTWAHSGKPEGGHRDG